MSTKPIYCAILLLAIQLLDATEPFERKAIITNNEKPQIDAEMEKRKSLYYLHQLMHDRKISYSKCKVCNALRPNSNYWTRQKSLD